MTGVAQGIFSEPGMNFSLPLLYDPHDTSSYDTLYL